LRSELCERLETVTVPSVWAAGVVAGSGDASFGPSFLGPEPTLLDRRWLLVVEERALLLNLPR
jgi:hypothetical protein